MRRRPTIGTIVVALLGWASVAGAWSPGLCDSLLAAHVHDGRVDYAAFRRDTLLRRCTEGFGAADTAQFRTRTERLAFWIDAYNMTVIASVVDHGIPAKVTDIPGFFDRERHLVAGRRMTLDEIENGVIRPLGDARVHCALVCGARSCPRLRSHAYTAARLDKQLDAASREFLADTTKNRFDLTGHRVELSRIFEWYRRDFERGYGSMLGFVAKYGPTPVAAWVDTAGVEIRYLAYDWSLNGT